MDSNTDGAVRLDDWGVIRAHGPDGATLLHGLLTQDVANLADDEARLAGLCSPKGRLLASFVAWKAAADDIRLACSKDLLPPTLKRLSMFVLRAKCKLTDATAESALYGLAGERAHAWLGEAAPARAWGSAARDAARVVRLPDAAGVPRHLLVQDTAAPPPDLPALDPSYWAWLEVRSAVARITAATAEQFVPQMVNFELVGGVNFQKGCYPGQEVVARSQYRGTLKRRAMLFDVSGAELRPGMEIFHSEDPGQPAGMVANAAQFGGRSSALVEVKLAALTSGALHAGTADGPVLRPVELPYPLPADAA